MDLFCYRQRSRNFSKHLKTSILTFFESRISPISGSGAEAGQKCPVYCKQQHKRSFLFYWLPSRISIYHSSANSQGKVPKRKLLNESSQAEDSTRHIQRDFPSESPHANVSERSVPSESCTADALTSSCEVSIDSLSATHPERKFGIQNDRSQKIPNESYQANAPNERFSYILLRLGSETLVTFDPQTPQARGFVTRHQTFWIIGKQRLPSQPSTEGAGRYTHANYRCIFFKYGPRTDR